MTVSSLDQIVFRTDADARIGTGHVMRCLTLADALARRGYAITFVTTEQTLATVPRLAGSGYGLHTGVTDGTALADFGRAHRAACLILDHYGLGRDYEAVAQPGFGHVIVIDDLPVRGHDCDLLLDQTYGRRPDEWRALVPRGCEVVTGTAYALLRPEFAKLRNAALGRRGAGAARRLLISLGGTDPDDITGRVLDAVGASGLDLAVDVVMGPGAPHLAAVRAQVARTASAHIHVGLDSLAPLMVQADLAVGAGGTTSWERCCLGLPTVALEIADNQRDVVAQLLAAGAAFDGGPCRPLFDGGPCHPLDPSDFARRLCTIALDPDALAACAEQAGRLCDGLGTARIAEHIQNRLQEKASTAP